MQLDDELRALLQAVADGECGVAEAQQRLGETRLTAVGDFAVLDLGRAARKGVPEVVYAAGKSVDQLVAIVREFVAHNRFVLCSKVSAEQADAVRAAVTGVIDYQPRSRTLTVLAEGYEPPPTAGLVGILAAGTSDIPAAEEAAVVCRTMGVETLCAYDLGVAGVHRLAAPLREMLERQVDAVVVAAGMEGALPSVVSGLVDVPVIGLPTSIGYGLGGRGEAALLGMLQSCAPGLAVVNIDNGVGAGAMAALIARRAASRA